MGEDIQKEDVMKEAKKYFSVSTRLPELETIKFFLHCKRLDTSASERLRELVLHDIKQPHKQIIAGKNKITYNKVQNTFAWHVHTDAGNKSEVLSNLSTDFLQNLKQEIDEAIKDRNLWVHQHKTDSVDIPTELLGDKV